VQQNGDHGARPQGRAPLRACRAAEHSFHDIDN